MAASISEAHGSSTRSSIPGRSGLTYDLTRLPPLIQKRAASSITTDFSVRNCKTTASSFVFEINDPPSPVSLTSNGMTCLCSEYKDDGGKAYQLYSQTVSPASVPDIPLTPGGPSPTVENLHTFLSTSTIDRLAQRLGWPTNPTTRDIPPFSLTDRALQVRDILSTFTRSILPSDHLNQEFATINRSRTAEECNVPLDLEATIFRLAVNDPAVHDALSRTQPPAACAEIFYSKLRRHIAESMTNLDNYLQYGPSVAATAHPSQLAESSAHFLAITARDLRQSVQHVSSRLSTNSPHGVRTAIECLLYALNAASARNYDLFQGISWERPIPAGEEDWQRNFWELCLRSSAETVSAESSRVAAGKRPIGMKTATDDEEDFFVLDTLVKMPSDTLSEKIHQLRVIRERLESQHVDTEYLTRFDEVLGAAATAEVSQIQTPTHSRAQSRAQTPTTTARGTTASRAGRGRPRGRGGETGSRAGQKRPASSAGGETPKRGGRGGRRGK
ncbi:MAG: hypothetical protein Q9160_004676 [Pyrenula sp. 1 TL-2023]